MRILISSNAPFGTTGYSTQCRGLIGALRHLGHDVDVYAWSGLQSGALDLGGVMVYPRLSAAVGYGQDAGEVARHAGSDLLITLQDVWMLPESFADSLPCPWVAWVPIDGDPVPESVLKIAKTADVPLVFSEFGVCKMTEAGLRRGPGFDYIPLAVDTSQFFPLDGVDRRAVRKAMNLPEDAFLISMVAANTSWPSRKSIGECLTAFADFREEYPEAVLYLHMLKEPPKGALGVWVEDLARELGIPQKALLFVDQNSYRIGLPDSYVANIYRASDVLLAPSQGEGFGLPIAEAQACGCPVITQNCTSMPELTVNGIAIEPLQAMWTPIGHFQYVASVPRIIAALEKIYGWDEAERAERAAVGIRHFRENYSWPVVTNRYWRPFMQNVASAMCEVRDAV